MSVYSVAKFVVIGTRLDRMRVLAIIGGVMIGVLLALLLWGGYTGLSERNERSTWTDPDRQLTAPLYFDANIGLAEDEVAILKKIDQFKGLTITLLHVAASPRSTVMLPGVGAPPEAGKSYLSPALMRLINEQPRDLLGSRYGRVIGTIPDSALAGPDSLVAVIGAPAKELDGLASVVNELHGTAYATDNYRAIAIVGAVAVFVPIVLLLAVSTGIGSIKRSEKLATLRLIGATRSTLAWISAVETAVTSVLGAALGVGLAWVCSPLFSRLSVGGAQFFPNDLRVELPTALIIASGVVLVAISVAVIRSWASDQGPLGASRERIEKRPRWWALSPLMGGVSVLSFAATQPASESVRYLVLTGFAFTTAGVLIAGPLMMYVTATLGSHLAQGAAGIVASGRIRRHPRQLFRSVSGVVVAVFLASMFFGALTAEKSWELGNGPEYLPPSTLVVPLSTALSPDDPKILFWAERLRAIEGVDAVAVLVSRCLPTGCEQFLSGADANSLGFETKAPAVRVSESHIVGPFSLTPTNVPGGLHAKELLVRTSDRDSIERARTALTEWGVPTVFTLTREEYVSVNNSLTWAGEYVTLARLGIIVSIFISALALAVSTLSGVLDRRRVLSLLRLAGMPSQTLRRILAGEALVPLLFVGLAAAGVGWFVAWGVVSGLTGGRRHIGPPGIDYYFALGAGLLLAVSAVLATFRTASTATEISSTRFE